MLPGAILADRRSQMNGLARFVPMFFDSGLPYYRITDRNGNPWWVVKDICEILGRKNPSRAVRDFPPEEVSFVVCDIT
jgi:prophage antirepressor-like protein